MKEVNTNRLSKQIDFIIEMDKMKTVLRQTLVMDKSKREDDAEHSWHIAVMAIILSEHLILPDVDINIVVKMLLLHDIIEIYAGDTFAFDTEGYKTKGKREHEAADKIFSILPSDQDEEYRKLWEEFEAMTTNNSMYANAIDRLQPFINNYKTNGHTWAIHKVDIEKVYKRMEIIKTTVPALWEFVETIIAECVEKGYISKLHS